MSTLAVDHVADGTEPSLLMPSGESLISEIAGSALLQDYWRAFPDAMSDACVMIRVAVGIDAADRHRQLLLLALKRGRAVSDEEWHQLCASVSWPRPLPLWERHPPKPVIIDGHGRFNFNQAPWNPEDSSIASIMWILLKISVFLPVAVITYSALRALPARIAGPVRRRVDASFASLL